MPRQSEQSKILSKLKMKFDPDNDVDEALSLADVERLITLSVVSGNKLDATPQAIASLLKIKEMRMKDKVRLQEERANKAKPTVLVVPAEVTMEKWQRAARRQQDTLTSETEKDREDGNAGTGTSPTSS